MTRITLVVGFALLLSPFGARADEPVPPPLEPAPPTEPVEVYLPPEAPTGPIEPTSPSTTWFVGEAGLGPAFGTGFPESPNGIGVRAALGVGGGFSGVPLRFYLMATLRYTSLWAHTESGFLTSDITRSLLDVSADFRMIWTIQRFRIHFDLGLGGSFLDSSAELNGRQTLQTDDARFAVYLAGGLGYRFSRWFAVNVLVEGAIPTTRPQSDLVSGVSRVPVTNDESLGWTSLIFNAAFHF